MMNCCYVRNRSQPIPSTLFRLLLSLVIKRPLAAGKGPTGWRAKSHTNKWAFKLGMRAGAYSRKSSAKVVERLKTASSEIWAVARTDPATVAEGVIALAQRIWPAFEHIDTSSGALGNAVHRTLDELLLILINAPADEKTRAKWLEQLREAIMDDGVDYLAPIADRFEEIAAYPALMKKFLSRPNSYKPGGS